MEDEIPPWLKSLILKAVQNIDSKHNESYKQGLEDAYYHVLDMKPWMAE